MDERFPGCRAALGPVAQDRLRAILMNVVSDDLRLAALRAEVEAGRLPPFIPDLYRLEEVVAKVRGEEQWLPAAVSERLINPTLELVAVAWAGLDGILSSDVLSCPPAPGSLVMVWRHPRTNEVRVQQATDAHLLALKVMADGLDPLLVANGHGVGVGVIDRALRQAVDEGLILSPPSALCRRPSVLTAATVEPAFLRTEVFTAQWHITQACDLHCKHCYDRTGRPPLPLDRGLRFLDDLRQFCLQRFVSGQVTFTGGNPLLYPHFLALYRGAVERGFSVAILGNPTSREQLQMVIAEAKPLFYQVSLEGLEAHNDAIRGPGHFARVIDFLALLKELGVYSMVMLTVTAENQTQVLALAEFLRDKVDLFTFTRLAQIGEGANLRGPTREDYRRFLKDYREAARQNPCLGFKENLFSLLAKEGGEPPWGGCTGHGCGAAFNFVAVLADGEVHACRKFPSPLGNAFSQGLGTVYDSSAAAAYRQGSAACQGCSLLPVCGGCLAVSHGLGLPPLKVRDPYCWREDLAEA